MWQLKYLPLTPSKRWRLKTFFDHTQDKHYKKFTHYKSARRTNIQGAVSLKGLRFKHRVLLHKFFIVKPKLVSYVAVKFGYQKYPLKEFFFAKTIFNQLNIFCNCATAYVGFILHPISYLILNSVSYVNQFIPLNYLPLNAVVSYVFNYTNSYSVFAKSSGVCAIRKKIIKKTKFISLQLPSTAIIFLRADTFCVYSSNANLQLNKNVDGKWGVFSKNSKTIKVRGVAQNPVDHPNGGRTKAKQPELSPWGWIAKQNK